MLPSKGWTRHLTTEKNKRIRLELLSEKKEEKQSERENGERSAYASSTSGRNATGKQSDIVGKQEAADAVRVLRTLLEHITHVYARVELRSRAFMTPPWPTNNRLLIVGLSSFSIMKNCEYRPKGWNSSMMMLFFIQGNLIYNIIHNYNCI